MINIWHEEDDIMIKVIIAGTRDFDNYELLTIINIIRRIQL
jgi:hypothetical protein